MGIMSINYPTLAHFRHFSSLYAHFPSTPVENVRQITPFYAKQSQFYAFFARKRRFHEKTNPIQTQLKPIQSQFNPKQTQFKPISKPNKPRQHPVGMTSSPINNPPLFASPADWISPNGKDYLNDPPDTKGGKVIIVDNDHINPWNSEPEWVWKNLFRGNHFILMDSYQDFRIDSPEKPEPKLAPTRRAMGLARKLSERIDLVSMTPKSELASTGYCLANPGREYLVYKSDGGHNEFTLTITAGKYSAEWINPSSNKSLKSQDHHAKTDTNIFVLPFNGSAILYLLRSER
jgi:hypothetical protein